jgi:ATP-dependent protease HslVU (ClpYQ) ATPase subunit
VNGGIVARLRLTPVLIHYDEMGYPQTDYEACKRYINDQGVKLMREAADEIERLRAERDEARRLVCELASEYKAEMFCPKGTMIPKSDRALAKAYGWDCFKEDTND